MRRRITAPLAAVVILLVLGAVAPARAAAPNVLRVGSYNGIPGTYTTIQAAVTAAQPGDWVLVGPGDYHEKGADQAGVYITTAGLHLRGMSRNTVIVDGTNPGSSTPCDSSPALQDLGPTTATGRGGRNGIEAWKVDGVSVENLTVCNYLTGTNGAGNQLWFNGGDGTGTIGMHALLAAYVTTSTSYMWAVDPAYASASSGPEGEYGIFTSNEGGPALIQHTYASNMADSDYYIGACRDCNATIDDGHAQNSALGFSGTNAGGTLVLQNSEWDLNKTGIAPNTLNNDDWPSPANGACTSGTGPEGTGSCTVIRKNYVHDNNSTTAPGAGIAAAGPPGTGIILSGVESMTVVGNRIESNQSWGVLVNDFPDTETPSPKSLAPCAGGTPLPPAPAPTQVCYYNAFGNRVHDNAFLNNGTTTKPGSADIADVSMPYLVGNCFYNNTDAAAPAGMATGDPVTIQTTMGQATCGAPSPGNLSLSTLQLVCGSSAALLPQPSCPNSPLTVGSVAGGVRLIPIRFDQPSMPDPCAGVPANPWCVAPAASPTASAPQAGPAGPIAMPGTVPAVGLANTAAAGPAVPGSLVAAGALAALSLRARRRRGGEVRSWSRSSRSRCPSPSWTTRSG